MTDASSWLPPLPDEAGRDGDAGNVADATQEEHQTFYVYHPSKNHPLMLLVKKPWKEGLCLDVRVQVRHDEVQYIREMQCQWCMQTKKVEEFGWHAVARARRRLQRERDGITIGRGRGGVQCWACVNDSRPPKSIMYELQAKGEIEIEIHQEVTVRETRENGTLRLYSGIASASSGTSQKSMETKMYADAYADLLRAQNVPKDPPSSDEAWTGDEEENEEANQPMDI